MNKSLLFIGLILFAPFVLADDAPYGDHVWTAHNILRPMWNNVIGLWGESVDEDVSVGMFGYTLKGWELNVCSQHVTGDSSYKPPTGFSGASTDLSKIYDDVATIEAYKYNYSSNETLIEVYWYIQPKTADIKYNVYLLKGSQKMYIDKNMGSDVMQGDTGFAADYFNSDYSYAVMEYNTGQEILRTAIIDKIQD